MKLVKFQHAVRFFRYVIHGVFNKETGALAEQHGNDGVRDEIRDATKDIAGRQHELGAETQDLREQFDNMKQSGQGGQSVPDPQIQQMQQAAEHLKDAATEQDAAAKKLDDNQPGGAMPRQQGASEQLKKALESMSSGDQGQQQQAAEEEQGQEQQQEQGDQEKRQEEQQASISDEAQDILDEEEENKRRTPARISHRTVDKDW